MHKHGVMCSKHGRGVRDWEYGMQYWKWNGVQGLGVGMVCSMGARVKDNATVQGLGARMVCSMGARMKGQWISPGPRG